MTETVPVLIAGAGPTGLTLAADLLRRGVPVRIVSAADRGFPGSRAKGIQPRTQEVFDDLGVLDEIVAHSTTYPRLGIHLGPATLPRTMFEVREPSESTPYPNTLLIAQSDTDSALHRRVEGLGGHVDHGTRLTALDQDADGVTATLETAAGTERVRTRYLVGADGGASTVRSACGIAFPGTTDDTDRMIVADLLLSGLSRNRWHLWPARRGRFLALCPLPGDDRLFQLMVKLRPDDDADTGPAAIERRIHDYPGTRHIRVEAVRWQSVWRPNTRLADRYRSGRVLLAGDAAHVHPPTGAQGLNTGVQDAYNLGWKLAQVLAGAPDALLDTYESERRPVAARVLGLAAGLYADTKRHPRSATTRGDEERQLSLTYRAGSDAEGIIAGDRVPDFRWTDPSTGPQRLFDHLRGPHFTLLTIGDTRPEFPWPSIGARLHRVTITGPDAVRAARTFPSELLIRPDGYAADPTALTLPSHS